MNKKNKVLFLIGMLVCLTGMVWAQTDPVEGFWISFDDKTGNATAGWEVYQKDGILYGEIRTIVGKSRDVIAAACKGPYANFPVPGNTAEMTVVDTPWIYGLTQVKVGEWKKGTIIDPEYGKLYGCEITFHPADGKKYKVDTLEMRGKLGPFGRSQFWQKATKEKIESL